MFSLVTTVLVEMLAQKSASLIALASLIRNVLAVVGSRCHTADHIRHWRMHAMVLVYLAPSTGCEVET